LLFAAALMSKPSALGLVPVFLFLDVFFGQEGRLATSAPLRTRWPGILLRMLPIGVLAGIALKLNLAGHAPTIVEPPGGSIFTAILTDLEIGWRYLVNLFAPFWLSAVYFVDPVRGVQDSRILQYGLALGAVIGGSIWLAPNRKLAVFLWLWLIGALGPSLNLVAIPHFMQDRYIYLSTPAFFLLLWQATARLTPRPDARLSPLRVLAPAYVGLLVVLALQRSFVWDTAIDIFTDAVEKQPKAAYARFGLGMSYGQAAEMEARKPGGDKARVDSYRQQWMEHWRAAIDQCPDVTRFSFYSEMALNVGEDCNVRGDLECAEKYWRLAAWPPPGVPEQAPARSLAMGWLASLRLSRRQNEQAYEFAHEALGVYPAEETVLLHARAAMALAKDKQAAGDVKEAKRLREQARIALGLIPAWSKNAPIAAELLKSLPAPNQ
ncbi:MAG TPA: hypothetical protein VEJ63_07940, partial [Planctomycetota bacterium]|nr:hypothetical protein [Planctomycetota bacterium]